MLEMHIFIPTVNGFLMDIWYNKFLIKVYNTSRKKVKIA